MPAENAQRSSLFIIGSYAYYNFTSFPYRTVSAYVSPLHAVRNVGECLLIAVHYLLQLVQIISGWGQLRSSVQYLASTCAVNLCLLWPLLVQSNSKCLSCALKFRQCSECFLLCCGVFMSILDLMGALFFTCTFLNTSISK